MRTQPRTGLAVEDLAWIHRDQFLHYLTLARATSDPADWPTFSTAATEALAAAFALTPTEAGADSAGLAVEHARRTHDPARDWDAFLETLWHRRGRIRPDLI